MVSPLVAILLLLIFLTIVHIILAISGWLARLIYVLVWLVLLGVLAICLAI